MRIKGWTGADGGDVIFLRCILKDAGITNDARENFCCAPGRRPNNSPNLRDTYVCIFSPLFRRERAKCNCSLSRQLSFRENSESRVSRNVNKGEIFQSHAVNHRETAEFTAAINDVQRSPFCCSLFNVCSPSRWD